MADAPRCLIHSLSPWQTGAPQRSSDAAAAGCGDNVALTLDPMLSPNTSPLLPSGPLPHFLPVPASGTVLAASVEAVRRCRITRKQTIYPLSSDVYG